MAKTKYRNCPTCKEGMSVIDTRPQVNGTVYRRYKCEKCQVNYKSIEEFVRDYGSKQVSELERLQNTHLAVIELLQGIAEGRNRLNDIETKLLEAFNKGGPSSIVESVKALVVAEYNNAKPLATPELSIGDRLVERKRRKP